MGNLRHPLAKNDFFLPLDNNAVFIASTTGKKAPYFFRISCELNEIIHLPHLKEALEQVAPRYPSFLTHLCPGMFWYYLDSIKKPLKIQADTRFPVEYLKIQRWNRYLFRVRVYGSRIACEFHHVLTDGTGAIEFLRSLVATYLTLRGVTCENWQDIKRPGTIPDPLEYEDAYAGLIRKDIPLPPPLVPAYRLTGPRYKEPMYRITTGTMSVGQALQVSRLKGVSLTALLGAVHLWALQSVLEESSSGPYKPLTIEIPVNMRKYHPSPTLRNFYLLVPCIVDRRLGHFDFSEILECVQHELKLGLQRKELDRQIKRNVAGEANFFARLVPLFIKTPVLRLVSRLVSNRFYSGSLSNLQNVKMPSEFISHIQRFDFIPPRNSGSGASIGIISWEDTLSVTVGSLVVDRSFERAFFTCCSDLGLSVRIESNL